MTRRRLLSHHSLEKTSPRPTATPLRNGEGQGSKLLQFPPLPRCGRRGQGEWEARRRLGRAAGALILMMAVSVGFPQGARAGQKPPAPPGATSAGSGQSTPGNAPLGQNKPGSVETGEPQGSPGKPAATATLQIKKEVPGDFLYRFVSRAGVSSAPAPLPAAGAGERIALPVPPGIDPHKASLEVLDFGRGNTAELPVATSGITSLTEGSFKYVQTLSVPVQANGKGISGVQVTLTNDNKTFRQEQLLRPGDNGVAHFTNVPMGEPVTVTVAYGDNPVKRQTETLTLDHPADGAHWQPIEVDWKGVMTVAPSVSAVPTSLPGANTLPGDHAAGTGTNGGSPLASLVSTLVGLLFLAGLAYGVYWAVMTGRMNTLFSRLGIQTGPLTETGPPAPNPFLKAEKTPLQPITEGTDEPLAGGGYGEGAIGHGRNGAPRLVATMGTYAGSIFPIAGPRIDIGRDVGNTVALPEDHNASRRHATILADNGQYSVTDNSSSNGTYVNGVRITSQTPQPLRPGDEVQIGLTRFRFEV